MKHLTAVLKDCERHSIRLATKEDRLEVRGNLTPELLPQLRRHKPNLLHYLRTGQCHHELPPEACKVCNGYVKKLIEEGGGA